MRSDERLMAQAAQRLTGKAVTVRLQRPVVATAAGQAYKTSAGAVIDVDPNFANDDTTLKVFLHECAHIKNDYGWMGQTTEHRAAPGSKTMAPAVRSAWRAGTPEAVANAQADKWMAYANRHYHEFERPGYTVFGQKLLALINSKGV